jgi:hypothetical protein
VDAFGEYRVMEPAHPELPSGRVQFSVTATPGTGPGVGGAGLAATGEVLLGVRRGLMTPHFEGIPTSAPGVVDTIASCGRTGGVLRAAVRGTLQDGGRFEVSVTDGAPSAPDAASITFPGAAPLGAERLDGGDVAIVAPEPCEPY